MFSLNHLDFIGVHRHRIYSTGHIFSLFPKWKTFTLYVCFVYLYSLPEQDRKQTVREKTLLPGNLSFVTSSSCQSNCLSWPGFRKHEFSDSGLLLLIWPVHSKYLQIPLLQQSVLCWSWSWAWLTCVGLILPSPSVHCVHCLSSWALSLLCARW